MVTFFGASKDLVLALCLLAAFDLGFLLVSGKTLDGGFDLNFLVIDLLVVEGEGLGVCGTAALDIFHEL